jgi:multidrug resistance protein, MATE family
MIRTLAILRLAWPILIAQWAVMLNAVMDTVMAGKLHPEDLASVGLGASIYLSVNVGLMGVLMALMPEIARHHGAKRSDLIARDLKQGLLLAAALSFPGMLLIQFEGLWQSFGDPGPLVTTKLNDYLFWIALALPATLLIRCTYSLNMGVERPKVTMIINLVSLLAKLPLNLVLMFGMGDWAGLGAPGCAAATALLSWLSLGLHLAVLHYGKHYREMGLLQGSWRPDFPRLGQLMRLGIPTAGGYLLEATAFTFMALWLARLGPSVSASHQIAANFATLIYMIGMCIATAASNLIARELGAGRIEQARSFAKTGLKLSALSAATFGALTFVSSTYIAQTYSDNPAIIRNAAELLALVALYHFFDVGQTVCSFMLRAYRVVQPTVWIFLICLWGIGLGLGYQLTFGALASRLFGEASFGLSMPLAKNLQTTPFGFWSGALIGVICAHTALLILLMRVMRRPLR